MIPITHTKSNGSFWKMLWNWCFIFKQINKGKESSIYPLFSIWIAHRQPISKCAKVSTYKNISQIGKRNSPFYNPLIWPSMALISPETDNQTLCVRWWKIHYNPWNSFAKKKSNLNIIKPLDPTDWQKMPRTEDYS